MATTTTRPDDPVQQDSLFYTHRLPNGLQMLGQYIPGVQSAAAVFYVNTGTRDENVAQMGVSHFLEHMAFKRTPHLSGDEIDRMFEELGAEHNAGTWKEFTFYWARVLEENVDPAIEILTELTHPVLDAEDFDQERNVILEEIARYEDMPSSVLLQHFMHDFYGEHPLAWETLGTAPSIKEMTPAQMRAYWQERYGASNVIFAIAGNFDWERVCANVERLTVDWDTGTSGRSRQPAIFTPSFQVYQHDQFVQEQVSIGVPAIDNTDPRYFTAAVLATVLGDDTGSRLYWSLYHEGLAESATAQIWDFDDNGVFWIHLSTEPSGTQKALAVVEDELRRLQEFDVQQDELDRAKAKLNSSVIIGGESTNERVMGLINSWLTQGRLETLEEIRQKIEAVTLTDLRQYLQEFPVWPRQVITAAGPLGASELQSPVE